MAESQTSNAGGGCCGCLGIVLIITGCVMWQICDQAVERNVCDQNQQISDVGFILFIVGVSLEGVAILLCICACCAIGCIACYEKNDPRQPQNVWRV